MAFQKIKQSQFLNTEQVARQIGGMKLSLLYNLPEGEFAKLIKDIEDEPLFRLLMYPDNKEQKVITYNRFPTEKRF